eukprot:3880353-Karenia_brevis.AAC.1
MMSKGKASDRSGIVVEMLQHGGPRLHEAIGQLFTELLQRSPPVPESWTKAFITVLYKKGDARQAENYRPITLLPILYKLFSRIIRARVQKTLEAAQSVDQA